MEHYLLYIIFLAAALTVAEEYTTVSDNVTCEDGKYYSCGSNKCSCDPDCVLFEDCCHGFENGSSNSSSTMFDENFIPFTTCSPVHGVAYNTPNKSLSIPYYLITKCPDHVSPESMVRQYCEEQPSTSEDIFITPIAVEGIGHFKNVYCAACHDMNPKHRDIEPWTWAWSCADAIGGESSTYDYDYDSYHLIRQGTCQASFRPGNFSFAARSCLYKEVISECSHNSNDTRVKCPSHLAPYRCNGLRYKNWECASCNGFDICKQENSSCEMLPLESIAQGALAPSILEYFRFSPKDTKQGLSCYPKQIYDPRTRNCRDVTTKVRRPTEMAVGSNVCLIFNRRSHNETFVTSPEDRQNLRKIAESLFRESPYRSLAHSSFTSDDGDLPSCEISELSNGGNSNNESVTVECTYCFKNGVDCAVLQGMNLSSFCSPDGTFNHTSSSVSSSLGTISVTKLLITVDSDCTVSKSLGNSPWPFSEERVNGTQTYLFSCHEMDANSESAGLEIVSLIGYILSILSLLFVIVTYSIFPKLRNTASKSVLTLSVNLLSTYFLMSLGEVSTNSKIFCKIVAALTHFFLLSFLFWMNALAFDLSRVFGLCAKFRARKDSRTLFLKYSLYAWGMPTVIVVAGLIIDLGHFRDLSYTYGSETMCWLNGKYAIFFGVGIPMALLLSVNAVMFVNTVVGIKRKSMECEKATERKSTSTKEEVFLYMKLSTLMGLTWILVFISDVVRDIVWLQYVIAVVISLQGVFIFLAFGHSKSVSTEWGKKLGIKPIKPRPSFRTSSKFTKLSFSLKNSSATE